MPAKVYFGNFRTKMYGDGIMAKLRKLILKAVKGQLDFTDKFTAIKMHFGEAGNLSYLRPNYARTVAECVRELGGQPFLTDCNTLYAGSRKNALEHLETANANGFTPLTVGCQIIIGDGLKGNDDVAIPVSNAVHCKAPKIGRVIADADAIISLAHFKGHEMMGIGGALKNLGMGCGSRAGKMEMHSDRKPMVSPELCVGCRRCQKGCAHNALTMVNGKMRVDQERCSGCGTCISLCPKDALQSTGGQSTKLLNEKTMEYAAAVLEGKTALFINVLRDISPNCDCHGENDAAILPNIGILVSLDPVAIDVASVDLCNKMQRLPQTALDSCAHGADVFDDLHPNTKWREAIDHAIRLGLGSDDYEMVTVD